MVVGEQPVSDKFACLDDKVHELILACKHKMNVIIRHSGQKEKEGRAERERERERERDRGRKRGGEGRG